MTTLAEVRAHALTVARDTSQRLRENADLPFEARREVADLILRGHPHMAALALDEYLREQARA